MPTEKLELSRPDSIAANSTPAQDSVVFIDLTSEDEQWLRGLTSASIDIDQQWLNQANSLGRIASGSTEMRRGVDVQDIQEARQEFFGSHLGWGDSTSDFHATYNYVREKIWIPSPANTIATQRVLHAAGLDGSNAAKVVPSVVTYRPERVERIIDILNSQRVDTTTAINKYPQLLYQSPETTLKNLGLFEGSGLDVPVIMKKLPNVSTYSSESLQKRIDRVKRIAEVCEWDGEATELIDYFPALLIYSDQKVKAHLRLLARFYSSGVSHKLIAYHVITPLEAHMISHAEEIDPSKDYQDSSLIAAARRVRSNTSQAERKEKIKQIISGDRDQLESVFGQRVLRAYGRYAESRGMKLATL